MPLGTSATVDREERGAQRRQFSHGSEVHRPRRLAQTCLCGYNNSQVMSWDVEVSDEFVAWFHALTGLQRIKITASVELLETLGPQLGFPHSSQVKGSR